MKQKIEIQGVGKITKIVPHQGMRGDYITGSITIENGRRKDMFPFVSFSRTVAETIHEGILVQISGTLEQYLRKNDGRWESWTQLKIEKAEPIIEAQNETF